MPAVTHTALTNYQAIPFRSASLRNGLLKAIGDRWRLWRSRSRDRNSFEFVDDRELRDLRISRWQVERERAKPFWRG